MSDGGRKPTSAIRFQCPECNGGFSDPHRRTLDDQDGSRYYCPWCDHRLKNYPGESADDNPEVMTDGGFDLDDSDTVLVADSVWEQNKGDRRYHLVDEDGPKCGRKGSFDPVPADDVPENFDLCRDCDPGDGSFDEGSSQAALLQASPDDDLDADPDEVREIMTDGAGPNVPAGFGTRKGDREHFEDDHPGEREDAAEAAAGDAISQTKAAVTAYRGNCPNSAQELIDSARNALDAFEAEVSE